MLVKGVRLIVYVDKLLFLILWLACGMLYGAAEQGFAERNINYGEDITRPLNRFDVRIEGQKGVNCRFASDVIVTARTDLLVKLPRKWQLGIRIDLPYAWYWKGSSQASCYQDLDHLDDSLLQVIAIAPSIGKWTFAFGLKTIFPTAGNNLQIGDGKYQLLPSFGCKYDLGNLSKGAYAGLILRHASDVAGYKSAPYICQTFIQPFLNVELANQWFINFSPQLIYNWRIKGWFVPFDMMVGKMITEEIILSLEYQTALVYDYKQFTQSIEFRIGYFY